MSDKFWETLSNPKTLLITNVTMFFNIFQYMFLYFTCSNVHFSDGKQKKCQNIHFFQNMSIMCVRKKKRSSNGITLSHAFFTPVKEPRAPPHKCSMCPRLESSELSVVPSINGWCVGPPVFTFVTPGTPGDVTRWEWRWGGAVVGVVVVFSCCSWCSCFFLSFVVGGKGITCR